MCGDIVIWKGKSKHSLTMSKIYVSRIWSESSALYWALSLPASSLRTGHTALTVAAALPSFPALQSLMKPLCLTATKVLPFLKARGGTRSTDTAQSHHAWVAYRSSDIFHLYAPAYKKWTVSSPFLDLHFMLLYFLQTKL